MLLVKQWNHYWIVASKGMLVTIICLWLQAHLQMKTVNKIVNIPFFVRIWKCLRNNTRHCWKVKINWSCFAILTSNLWK
jgi:hypothetical protein